MTTRSSAAELSELVNESLRAPQKPTTITNTAALAAANPAPATHVLAVSGRIEAQEAHGQQELVNSEQLPAEWLYPKNALLLLARFGVKMGKSNPKDSLFVTAELPPGWRLAATGHSMWSDLVDDKGRKRAGIFYKAAFCDRHAHGSLNCRFSIRGLFPGDEGFVKEFAQSTVRDGDRPVFTSGKFALYEDSEWEKNQNSRNDADAQCRAWLADRYPNWQDHDAYWDQE